MSIFKHEAFLPIFALTCALSLLAAIAENSGSTSDNRGRCDYSNIVSFYPPHILFCELLKRRF